MKALLVLIFLTGCSAEAVQYRSSTPVPNPVIQHRAPPSVAVDRDAELRSIERQAQELREKIRQQQREGRRK